MVGRKGMAVSRRRMPERPPGERVNDFKEVPLGYSAEDARAEAARCLQCARPACVEGCPVGIDIPGFIARVRDGEFEEAVRYIRRYNVLPAVCGRVCPQEVQCEARCVLGRKGEAVAVGDLERFVGDFAIEHRLKEFPTVAPAGVKVAVVGSGPAGLTAAMDLRAAGCEVTVFEALHEPGGVLTYGIPPFRLPRDVVRAEIEFLAGAGVEFRTDFVVGRTVSVEELVAGGYDAVFLGAGAGYPVFLGVEGETLPGVYSANEYLLRVNLMHADRFPEYDTPVLHAADVVVVGGGNVAMDAARVALRMRETRRVTVLYRRGREEMPARAVEVRHAEEEGVRLECFRLPKRFLPGADGRVGMVEFVRTEPGEPDASGRRRPVEVPGSEETIDAGLVIVAVGTRPNPLLPAATSGLRTNRRGGIEVDPRTGRTSLERVYAAGDVVTGSATVIEAMGAARRAVRAMLQELGVSE